MNNIEYRAWDKKYSVYHLNALPITEGLVISGEYKGYVFLPFDDSNYIFEQFTGQVDNKNKKIFAGDIIKYDGFIGKVIWNNKDSCYEVRGKDVFTNCWNPDSIEVVGTILEDGDPDVTKRRYS